MSFSVNASDLVYTTIPGSPHITTLTMPKGKTEPKADMIIVYLSKELLAEELYTVKPISVSNFESCKCNGLIKKDKLLAVIQLKNNQQTISMHESHIPNCPIDLYYKLDKKNVLVLSSFSEDKITSLSDEQYNRIDAIYTTYLQATLAELDKQYPQKQKGCVVC